MMWRALLAVLAGVAAPALAESTPLFEDDTPLRGVLTFEAFDGPATLDLDGRTFPLKLEQRGKSRREHCRFPPLRLNFKRKTLSGTVLEGQNKLKLVTHCSGSDHKRGNLAAEYLIYRMYNQLTEQSFRVRWIDMTYVRNGRPTQTGAFLIEHKRSVAKRLGIQAMKTGRVKRSQLQPDASARLNLFAYMVGNTDFSLLSGPPGDDCCHNVVPFQSGDEVIPIPYDFDATGLVNPGYAAPAEQLSIRKVTQRLYRGFCIHDEALAGAKEQLAGKREALLNMVSAQPNLPDRKRKQTTRYLTGFFDRLERFNEPCR